MTHLHGATTFPAPGTQACAAPLVWSLARWEAFESRTRRKALAARHDADAWRVIARAARRVMAAYTTSFFIVSRFLPTHKRRQVEVIYAAVRYPDEVVDSFPLTCEERERLLARWADEYGAALGAASTRESLELGASPFLAAFAEVVRQAAIPEEHYQAFLAAMRRDIRPESFVTLDDLIDNYIYGSATVVGYFLAHVYGASAPHRFSQALAASRDLAIALQLTNFIRDVREDQRRGRIYLPLELLREHGVEPGRIADPQLARPLTAAVRQAATVAESHYTRAAAGLGAFAPDCQVAIKACIDVYGALNRRIAANPDCLARRESVPFREKWRNLPPGKYWRLPLALLTSMR